MPKPTVLTAHASQVRLDRHPIADRKFINAFSQGRDDP
jgi:hypothetical protein